MEFGTYLFFLSLLFSLSLLLLFLLLRLHLTTFLLIFVLILIWRRLLWSLFTTLPLFSRAYKGIFIIKRSFFGRFTVQVDCGLC